MDLSDEELDTLARALGMAYLDARQMGDEDLMARVLALGARINREVMRREVEDDAD